MKCLIIDDEPLAIQLLTDYALKANLEVVGAFTNPIEALHFLNENEVDLLFLDIQMPKITGIQFLKITNRKYPVILTTAYEKYALESYELDVVDYLLKPITFQRFLKAVEKFRARNTKTTTITVPEKKREKDYFFVKSGHQNRRISFEQILFLEGLGDYVAIHVGDEKVLTLENMKDLVQTLPKTSFLRIHKSFIVNLDKINYVERNRVVIGERYIPVSDTYKDALREAME